MHLKKLNKDKNRRNIAKSFEIKIKSLKSLLNYLKAPTLSQLIEFVYLKLSTLNKNIFFSRINNLCILTGRQNGVYRLLKISRISLRDSKQDIYGFKKSSW